MAVLSPADAPRPDQLPQEPRRLTEGESFGPSPSTSHGAKTAGAIGWSSAGTAAQVLAQSVTLPITARLVAPEAFGAVALALSIIAVVFSTVFAVLVHAIVEPSVLEGRHLDALWSLSAWASGVLCLLVLVGAGPIERLSGVEGSRFALFLVVALIPFRLIGAIPATVLSRELRFRTLTLAQVISNVVGYMGVGIGLAIAGFGIPSLAFGMVAQEGIQFTILAVVARDARPKRLAGRSEMVKSVDGVKVMSVAGASVALSQQVDNFAVGYVLGSGPLGQYSRAYRLSSFTADTFTNAIGLVLFPSFARVRHQPERLIRAVAGGLLVCVVLVLPGCVYLGLESGPITLTILGDQWGPSVAALTWLGPGALFRIAGRILIVLQRSLGLKNLVTAQSVATTALIGLGALVGGSFGLRGVAVGVFCGLAAGFLLSLVVVCLRLPGLGRAILPSAALAVVGVGGCVGLRRVLPQLGIPGVWDALVGSLAISATLVAVTAILVRRTSWAATSWIGGQLVLLRHRAERTPFPE